MGLVGGLMTAFETEARGCVHRERRDSSVRPVVIRDERDRPAFRARRRADLLEQLGPINSRRHRESSSKFTACTVRRVHSRCGGGEWSNLDHSA